jgi:hypothetical protein
MRSRPKVPSSKPNANLARMEVEGDRVWLAARSNAQPRDDPLPALSLSTRRFAKGAAAHAASYRRIISAEALDIQATGDVVPPL